MVWTVLCWMLVMASGLLWDRRYTQVLLLVLAVVAVATRTVTLTEWTGLARLLILGLSPWLLVSYREAAERLKDELHAQEAQQTTKLQDATRFSEEIQKANQDAEAHIAAITDLYRVTKETVRALHVKELFDASLTIAPRLLSAGGLRLMDWSGDKPQLLRARRRMDGRMTVVGEGDAHSAGEPAKLLEVEEAIMRQVVSLGQPASAAVRELASVAPTGISRMAWAPLWREQKAVGALVADELPEQQLKTLSIVANQLSLQLSRIQLFQQVEALAVTDALTGLFVRNYFMERARDEIARCQRLNMPSTVLMIDLDRFKEKNDTYGHLVGDVVLRDVARLLQRNLREIDLIARYGGEEFILLLTESSAEQAEPIAQRLKQLVEAHPIRAYDELLTQTISMGMASFPNDGRTLDELVEHADQALYAAKRSGRNQVVRWIPTSST